MARRVFEIAKDLGVDSKAIVAKCQAEGIPETVVKNHMSTISAGLEQTIREWFSTSGGAATAIETTEKVDLEKVKVKKAASRKAAGKGTGEGGDASTATIDAPAPIAPAPTAPTPPATPTASPAAPTTTTPSPAPITPARAKPAGAPPAPAPVAPAAPATATTIKLAPARVEPPAPAPTVVAAPAPAPTIAPAATTSAAASAPSVAQPTAIAPASDHAKATPIAPTMPTSAPKPPTPPPAGPGAGPGGAPGARAPIAPRTAPAPMNVPTRPTVVSPAGPQLVVKTPVKLSGPKVVRVEAPEQVAAPRPRGPRPPMGGAGGRPGSADDDRSRSPRRKEGPGTSAGVGAKRSSGAGVPERRRGRSDADWIGTTQGIYSEQDLIEREARLARAGGFLKKRKQELTKAGGVPGAPSDSSGRIKIAAPFTIKDLSAATGVKGADIVKKLFMQGVMATINSSIEPAKAIEIMMDFDIELEVTEAKTAEETVSEQFVTRTNKDVRSRGPVVTILGHVDHGKTSLLDRIRNANVAAGEAGGITQKTSAFVAPITVEGQQKQVVFLDTPGHEAFTGMRARGAKITDIVVLVVSAPEGVMPQTIESVNHARAAGVPIVVALNKVDRPDATEQQIQKTLGQLAAAGVNTVDWGGDVECVRVSATTGVGIPKLLEILDLQAGVLELKADFDGPAQGTVIEAKMEEGRGVVANILVQQGRLKVGDFVVLGRSFGRVRDITDDKGVRVKEASPPMPVQISGLNEVCDAGDKFFVTRSLREAEEAAEQRRQRERLATLAQPRVTLDNLFSQMQAASDQVEQKETTVKEIKIVLKTDQQGTVDVLKSECEKIKTDEIKVRVIDSGVGGITESNVILADASRAIVIGFNVIPSGKARQLAEAKGVEIRTYQVIYDIVEDLKKAAEGMLSPELREDVLGHAEVRAVFKISKVGSIAGCYITDGTVARDALIRVTRNGVVIEHDRKLSQLKRLKDDAKEVRSGMECGMKIDGYDDIKEGDVLECYKKIEVKRTL